MFGGLSKAAWFYLRQLYNKLIRPDLQTILSERLNSTDQWYFTLKGHFQNPDIGGFGKIIIK